MWSFDDIAKLEPRRAELLRYAPAWSQLQAEVLEHFQASLRSDSLAIGLEQFGKNTAHSRVVMQFHVGETLLDRFFNATTGYRAQFRLGWQTGYASNTQLITALSSAFSRQSSEFVRCRVLSPDFADLGAAEVTRAQILESLEPEMAKIWACALAFDRSGGVRQQALGITGPALLLTDGTKWPAIFQEDADAILEVKGAYLGESGAYQYKAPSARAKALESSGEPGCA